MNDKIIHFIASTMITIILALFIHYAFAMFGTLFIGILIQLYDKYVNKNYFDWMDLCFDSFGALAGMLISTYTI